MILRAWVWVQLLTFRPRRRRYRPLHPSDRRIEQRDHVIADIRRQVHRIEREQDPFSD